MNSARLLSALLGTLVLTSGCAGAGVDAAKQPATTVSVATITPTASPSRTPAAPSSAAATPTQTTAKPPTTTTTKPPASTTTQPPTLTLVLKGSGIGDLAFGTPRAEALARLKQALGTPTTSTSEKATWSKKNLTVYFIDGSFASWTVDRPAPFDHTWSLPLWIKEETFRAEFPDQPLRQTCPGDDAHYTQVAKGVTYIWENVVTGAPTENRTVWGGHVKELDC